jgi:hypothetical protein
MTWTTTFLKHVAILTLYAGNQRKNHREKTGKAPVCGTVAGRAWLDEWPSRILLCAGWIYLFMVVYVDFMVWKNVLGGALAVCHPDVQLQWRSFFGPSCRTRPLLFWFFDETVANNRWKQWTRFVGVVGRRAFYFHRTLISWFWKLALWGMPAMAMQVQWHWGMYFGSNFSTTTSFFPMHRRNSRDWPLGPLDYVFGGRLTAWVGVHWIFLDSW